MKTHLPMILIFSFAINAPDALLGQATPTANEEAQNCEQAPEDPAVTRATWEEPGVLAIRAGDQEGLLVTISHRVNLGPLRLDWEEKHDMAANQRLTIPLRTPSEAFLHEFASVYAADLLVRVKVTDQESRPQQEIALDPLLIAWPNGPQAAPRIWYYDAGPPNGVLDPELQRAAASFAPHSRLVAPLAHLRPRRTAVPEDTTGEDTPLSEQFPADQNDESGSQGDRR